VRACRLVTCGTCGLLSIRRSTNVSQDMGQRRTEGTYCAMPNRRHPSRFVVFKRSSIWKNGTGEDESVSGGPPGILAMTASTFHGAAELMSASSRG